ncbi:threonine synthase [Rhodoplanes sp. TEM]|uniref:Threonine synthase n=1 Tax=Rhodoplanes tepidamans TaxID=200616 RepID=A0ABT5JAT2_RHOTP|nr:MULTISPECIES: threonine synthase [Rhodoplanes]MDC7786394.1 threonine synthase [Rhodoplanes tepidamans]MDC7985466.1 threonine synthase [Rhodoplanes sp. TEM]MDQ0354139.1 threonine synthase [Rhodoplanes tepidamans]
MQYISTRGEAPPLGFMDVTLAGLARDGGLYVPETWPGLDAATIAGFAGRPYAEVFAEVVMPFVGDQLAATDLARMAREAYDSFRHPAVVPLVQVAPSTFVLELFHGPTLAFKDLAMQVLSRLMDHALMARGERSTIVVATSGDTGGAAVEAFRGSAQADLFVLFPQGRISDVQRRMMTTAAADNVHALAIEGTFDDCQAIVKGLFNDHPFRDGVRLSGVNSINFARLVAQVVYYFAAAAALGAPHRKVAFTVPTGNFGDVFSGYVAARMGLPVDKLLVATNVNDILARTLATGTYQVRDVVPTSSPSMDIQVSSNFERLLFEACERDPKPVRAAMASLARSQSFSVTARSLGAMRALFSADRAAEEEVAATIRTVRREAGYLVDPHTAVALAVAEKEPRDPSVPMVVLSTAHPAKFPDAVEAACGIRPALPDWLADLGGRTEHSTVLPADQSAVARYIQSHSRAASAGAGAAA